MLTRSVRPLLPFLLLLASLGLTPSAHAKYRYDSFGNLLVKSGPLAEANLNRFSGKEYHPRSGLYYYGFRYYQPNLQRWLNQDPIGIAGGLNLYGFVGNDPIDLMDPYGLSPDDFFQCMADEVKGLNDLLGKGEEGLQQGMAALNDLNHAVNPILADGFDYLNAKVSGMKSAASDYAGWVGRGAYDSMMGGASGQGSQYSKANLDAEAGLTSGVNDLARETAGVAAQMMFDGGMLLAEAAVTKKLADLPGPGPKKGTPSCPVKPPNAAKSSPTPRLVIGRGSDLAQPGALGPGEFKLSWPPTGTVRTEWKVNSGLMRQEMQNMRPIRDASIGDTRGMYLNAERNLLESRGWKLDKSTSLWMPPTPAP